MKRRRSRLRRVIKWTLLVIGVLALGIAGLLASIFIGRPPIPDGLRLGAVEVVKDGIVSACLIELGPGAVALVDAGNDKHGAAILGALRRRGLGPEAVKAVLLTHGDYDHTNGAHLFPRAQLLALADDVALVEGRVGRALRGPHPNGLHVTRALRDGEVLELAGTRVEVLALPGHTPGSAAYLARGVLFLGDSAESTKDGKLEPATWLFCSDRPRNRASLRALADRLRSRASEVTAIVCSHTGALSRGLAPLLELSDRLKP